MQARATKTGGADLRLHMSRSRWPRRRGRHLLRRGAIEHAGAGAGGDMPARSLNTWILNTLARARARARAWARSWARAWAREAEGGETVSGGVRAARTCGCASGSRGGGEEYAGAGDGAVHGGGCSSCGQERFEHALARARARASRRPRGRGRVICVRAAAGQGCSGWRGTAPQDQGCSGWGRTGLVVAARSASGCLSRWSGCCTSAASARRMRSRSNLSSRRRERAATRRFWRLLLLLICRRKEQIIFAQESFCIGQQCVAAMARARGARAWCAVPADGPRAERCSNC